MSRYLPLLLLCLACEIAAAQPAGFPIGTRRTYPVGTSPKATAVGDFNRDGNLDFAVTLRDVDSVAVRLGDGKGSFGAVARYATNGPPFAITAGDLNGDGRLDLVTANTSTNTVSVFKGLINGQFATKVDFPTAMAPAAVTIGDANGDTRPDAVVACTAANAVTVLVGTSVGPGLTGTSFNVPTGPGPNNAAIADLNGDGLNDIVTSSEFTTSMSVLRGLPNGTFAPKVDHLVGAAQAMVALGDVNGDGLFDAVTVDHEVDKVSVLLGDGNGGFGLHDDRICGSRPTSIVIADVTGDGRADLVVGNTNGAFVSILAGTAGGIFLLTDVPTTGSGSGGLSVADLDGDGRRDLLFPGALSNVMLMSANGAGVFGAQTPITVGASPGRVALGDLDGDTDNDMVVVNYEGANASVMLNSGNGSFAPRVDYPTTNYPAAVALGDVGSDGLREIVVATSSPFSPDTNRVVVLPNLGGGAFGPRIEFGLSHERHDGIALGDVNTDGKLDIAVPQAPANNVQLWLGDGLGGFSPGFGPIPTGTDPITVRLVDFNANGALDLLVANSSESSISAIGGNILGQFGSRVDYITGTTPAGIATGDLDLDGDLDVAVTNILAASVSILLNNGTGAFVAGTSMTGLGGQPGLDALGDVNGDGLLDLMYPMSDQLITRLGLVGAKFTPAIGQPVGAEPFGLALADLDGNGTLDAVVSNRASNSVSVLFGLQRTRTSLTVTPPTSQVNAPLTFAATVIPAGPDTTTLTGTVRFFDGQTLLGTAPVDHGVATTSLPGTRRWERQFRAEYLGDARYYGSLSPPVTHVTYEASTAVEPGLPPVALAVALARNPVVDGSLRVRLSLASPGQAAEVSVVDVRGRVVARAAASSGEQTLELARGLAPGVYLVRLVQGGKAAVARAVVL